MHTGYTFAFSPNDTLDTDIQAIKQLSGLVSEPDQMNINPIFSQLTFCMGAWPWAYAALLVPSGRSSKGVRDLDLIQSQALPSKSP